jgi:hypothetical protein
MTNFFLFFVQAVLVLSKDRKNQGNIWKGERRSWDEKMGHPEADTELDKF